MPLNFKSPAETKVVHFRIVYNLGKKNISVGPENDRKRLKVFLSPLLLSYVLFFLLIVFSLFLSRVTSLDAFNLPASFSSYNLFLILCLFPCMVPVFESPNIGAELADCFFIITTNRNKAFFYQNFYSLGIFNLHRMKQADI